MGGCWGVRSEVWRDMVRVMEWCCHLYALVLSEMPFGQVK